MTEEPYRWLEAISNRREYIRDQLKGGTPVFAVCRPEGIVLFGLGQGQSKVFEVFDRHAMAALGHPVDGITFVAMSHYHADHTANANAFAKSTWIVQQAEYDMMFKDGDVNIRSPETYKDLKDARRITLANADHDVFGDGTVIIKTAPGHTPGHQMLFLKLQHFGPLLLAGDLWHLPEERALDRVPTFDFDAAMTRATRVRVEQFLKESGAQMWIQHDPPTYAALKKAPAYYD